jgi:PPP family 3-phenylpropionic acid transporter
MFLSSSYYFIHYAALATLSSFQVLFYQSLGLPGSQIGLLTGIAPLVGMVSAPFWTGVADATHRHKRVLLLTISGSVAVALVIPHLTSFAWLIPFVALLAFLTAPVIALVDSATMAQLGEGRGRYGRIRLWGTIGWAVMAPVAGWVIDRTGLPWAYRMYALGMLLALLVAVNLPFHQERSGVSFWHGMRGLLKNRSWMLFLAMVFISGAGLSTMYNYLFIFMESLGASKTLMGLSLTISTISEVPVLFFGERLLRRFGTRGLMLLAMGAIGVRLLLYSFSGAPWVILLIQLVHGLTFPLVLVAGVAYADQAAPAGLRATAQGMFNSTLIGVSSAAGAVLGGILIDQVGPAGMYRLVGSALLFCLVIFRFLPKKA